MYSFIRSATVLWSLVFAGLCVAEVATIELTDGSTIRGEVIALNADTYRVKSAALGMISIPQSDVKVVRYGDPAVLQSAMSAGNSTNHAAAMAGIQSQLAESPEIMARIHALRDDPALTAVLADDSVRTAMASGDLEALRANPQIQALLQHPIIREILQQFGGVGSE